MECHEVRLSILISNVLILKCFLGVAWRLFRIEMVERKSYMRKCKLSVTQWTLENGKNISSASRKFNVDRKRIRALLKQEESLVNQKRGSRSNARGCTSRFPLMEQAFYDDYKKSRDKGKPIKYWWFNCRAKQLVKEFYPDENFKASDQWFSGFTNRLEISLPRKTHCAQKDPQNLSYSIWKFHSKVLRIQRRRTYQMKDIANMDQTPLPFVMDNEKTFPDKGSSEVWCSTHGSDRYERQCSVQLTTFADGKPQVKHLVIFRGKGLRSKSQEHDAWD